MTVLLRRASKDGRSTADSEDENPRSDSLAGTERGIPEARGASRSGVAPKRQNTESRAQALEDSVATLPEFTAPEFTGSNFSGSNFSGPAPTGPRPARPGESGRRRRPANVKAPQTKRWTAALRLKRDVTVTGKNIVIWVALGFGGGAVVTLGLHALSLALHTTSASASPTVRPAPVQPAAAPVQRNPQGLPWDVPPPPMQPGAE